MLQLIDISGGLIQFLALAALVNMVIYLLLQRRSRFSFQERRTRLRRRRRAQVDVEAAHEDDLLKGPTSTESIQPRRTDVYFPRFDPEQPGPPLEN